MIKKIIYIFLIFLIFLTSCDEQPVFNRNISNNTLEKVKAFEYEDGRIIRSWTDEEFIYLSSSPDNSVKVFNYNGEQIRSIGEAGEAPWTNGTIWYFTKLIDTYWIHDYPKMALKKYDLNADTLQCFQRIITKHNVIHKSEDVFVVPTADNKDGIFYLSLYDAIKDSVILNLDINKLTGRFEKLPPFGDYTFQGEFCKNKEGEILYYCSYNSSFFFIDKKNEITHHVDIRNLPISEPVVRNNSILLKPLNIGIVSATMDNSYIYLLTPTKAESNWRILDYCLDVYDIETKKYIKSYKIPVNKEDYPVSVSISDKYFSVVYTGGQIFVYNKKFLNDLND